MARLQLPDMKLHPSTVQSHFVMHLIKIFRLIVTQPLKVTITSGGHSPRTNAPLIFTWSRFCMRHPQSVNPTVAFSNHISSSHDLVCLRVEASFLSPTHHWAFSHTKIGQMQIKLSGRQALSVAVARLPGHYPKISVKSKKKKKLVT